MNVPVPLVNCGVVGLTTAPGSAPGLTDSGPLTFARFPFASVTRTVTVTGWPTTYGPADGVTRTVVAAPGLTVMLAVFEVSVPPPGFGMVAVTVAVPDCFVVTVNDVWLVAVFTVTEVGHYGHSRAAYLFTLDNPVLLLQLIRERVTSSVVLQRGYLVEGKKGFKVIGRRSPAGGPISWMHEFDAGIDPDRTDVQEAAEAALAQAKSDVGE